MDANSGGGNPAHGGSQDEHERDAIEACSDGNDEREQVELSGDDFRGSCSDSDVDSERLEAGDARRRGADDDFDEEVEAHGAPLAEPLSYEGMEWVREEVPHAPQAQLY